MWLYCSSKISRGVEYIQNHLLLSLIVADVVMTIAVAAVVIAGKIT